MRHVIELAASADAWSNATHVETNRLPKLSAWSASVVHGGYTAVPSLSTDRVRHKTDGKCYTR